jgi:hypothetical protein
VARWSRFPASLFFTRECGIVDGSAELVSVCLPPAAQFDSTLAVTRARLPLLAEKPLAATLAQARQLIEEAASRSLFFATSFNHRYALQVTRFSGCRWKNSRLSYFDCIKSCFSRSW